jgi:lysophospholipase L1-like esterase
MKTPKALFRITSAAALAVVVASPAAAQVDFTTFVQIGDSLTAGYTDGCLVEHGQRDSFGAILARQAGAASFEQPLVKEPGLGPCTVLTGLTASGTPIFGSKPNTGTPLNANLPRPYNNLAVPGFTIKDTTTSKTAADNGNPFTDLVLRNPAFGNTTQLQQAASLKPTFTTIFIGNNDILNSVGIATVIDGATLTTKAAFQMNFQLIIDTMKAAQGGTGKGIVFGLPDITTIPFTTTVSPFIAPGLTYLGQKSKVDPATGLNIGFDPIAPIPATSRLTLQAGNLIPLGFGIPCAIKSLPNCDKPLPDGYLSIDVSSGTPKVKVNPGVVLYPDEVTLAQSRTADFNGIIKAAGTAAGYTYFDTSAYFAELKANGRDFGGMIVTTSYLQGGFFGYDGVHPTSIGYAIFANDLISFINANYGTSIPAVNLSPFLFNGNAQAGGYPVGLSFSSEETLAWAAEIWGNESFRNSFSALFSVTAPEWSSRHVPVAPGSGRILQGVERHGRVEQP